MDRKPRTPEKQTAVHMAANDNRVSAGTQIPGEIEWDCAEPIGKAAARLLRAIEKRKSGS